MLEVSQQEKILDAAYAVIAREGYTRTSLRQIAQEAGVAVSQISYHFKNKQGLLLAVARRVANKYFAYMQSYLKPEMSPRQKGECFIRLYQEVLENDPDLFRVLYDLVGLALWSDPLRGQVREIFAGVLDQITAEVFTKEIMGELGTTYSPETLASLFFSGIFGIAVQSLLNPGNKIITESLDALNVILKVGEVKLT
ncbi:MAG: TetR/AcrR family transcriptional regulator [Firmicutes bacterium]|nr:TetR/AcrR family transcriptional regulator [Bacillota bacterium]